jgi:hypothetical protein
MLVADKLANGEEPKDARRGYAIAIAIMGRTQPGFYRLLAIGERRPKPIGSRARYFHAGG